MRRAIAEHMLASRAHRGALHDRRRGRLHGGRAEIGARKEQLARRGVPLTYLAFVAHAVVEALGEHPILNASIDGDELVHHEDVNLGIAVALDDGLVVPVIRKAQRLSLEGLAAAIAELAGRARSGELAPDDLAGGTFTITNPGQFGAVIATPIINQPQVGILDLEAVVRRPVVVTDADGERVDRDPSDVLPLHVLGPPCPRRRRGRALPGRGRRARIERGERSDERASRRSRSSAASAPAR